jgi:hypothetical protein
MTCVSQLGSGHRFDVWTFRNQLHHREVFLCSEHRALVDDSKRAGLRMCITDEGAVYPEAWMASIP